MREVTRKEIWDFVKDKNVTYSAVGRSPFEGHWKDRSGNLVAKSIPFGKHLGINDDRHKYKHYII